jgi:hypothetical protein
MMMLVKLLALREKSRFNLGHVGVLLTVPLVIIEDRPVPIKYVQVVDRHCVFTTFNSANMYVDD